MPWLLTCRLNDEDLMQVMKYLPFSAEQVLIIHEVMMMV
jgi:hypothetical protein